MFYVLAKLIALIILPSSMGLIATALGLSILGLTSRRRLGMMLAVFGISFLAIAGFSPLANWILYPLEQRFAHSRLPEPDDPVTGIIILGGFEDARVSAGRPGLGLNESAERLTEGLRLARRWPDAKLVFTGGVVRLFTTGVSTTGPIGAFLQEMGIEKQRLVLEGSARNTYENATFTRDMVNPKPGDTWLLVTSAYHMPRAMGVFRKAGFNVTPAPTDYRTRDAGDLMLFFSRASRGLLRIDVVTKEWIGLLAYWLTRRSIAIFPGPEPKNTQE